MAIGLAALGLLAFLLGCSGTFAEPQNSESAPQCSLIGIWKSAVGNIIEIFSVSDTGLFSGTFYVYWLPPLSLRNFESPLQGIQHQGRQPNFAFTFSFIFDGGTVIFVGQCLVDENGKEQLRTTWVLRSDVEFPGKDWEATRVERSTFYRIE